MLALISFSQEVQYSRDGGEHALVDGEQQIGDLGAPNRGSAQDIAESNVIEVADKLASRVRKG